MAKQSPRIQLLPFLIYPYLASFVLFLYLPSTNPGWRFATLSLAGFSGWSLLNSYRRRAARKREAEL
jgi:hypothetical protein